MKILVPIKRVIDYNVKIHVKADETGVDLANVKMSLNPFDEIAVEEAVRLKEAGKTSEIIVVSIGSEKAQEQIRTAIAMGADRGILVQTDDPIDLGGIEPLAVAKILKILVEKENPDFVLMGKQSIDDDSNQTGQMLSALLGWAQGTFASAIEVNNKSIIVTREIDGGRETLKLKMPAVITTDLRLNEPRYAKLSDIIKAKKKELEIISINTLDIDCSPRLKIIKVTEPPARQNGIKVSNVDELIDKLKNEAKVLS
ncbi:MAG: electron transfer flavoprotein subunit beta/FixA family protein [Alphaproteobacteria bacterium]|nr:electron transfer flavoprotein subunit beta/FixA family protein [Alphaproteobacteria bacterium]